MRSLTREKQDLITSIVSEGTFPGITAALLEKDEHLTTALEAIFRVPMTHAHLVFCGGTSLSKGHALIERMSEDADIKIVLSPDTRDWPRNRLKTYLRDEVGNKVYEALEAAGFEEDEDQRDSLNEYRYLHSQWRYERAFDYDEAAALRPNLQIELTVRTPVLQTGSLPIGTLADRIATPPGTSFSVETVAVAETLAEKVLSFLRRYAQHRAGQMTRAWDTALVRHIYDVYCINQQAPQLVQQASSAFAALVQGDLVELGRQHPEFVGDPAGILRRALNESGADLQTREEYDRNLLPLVYGNTRPSFDEAWESYRGAAETLLSTL